MRLQLTCTTAELAVAIMIHPSLICEPNHVVHVLLTLTLQHAQHSFCTVLSAFAWWHVNKLLTCYSCRRCNCTRRDLQQSVMPSVRCCTADQSDVEGAECKSLLQPFPQTFHDEGSIFIWLASPSNAIQHLGTWSAFKACHASIQLPRLHYT